MPLHLVLHEGVAHSDQHFLKGFGVPYIMQVEEAKRKRDGQSWSAEEQAEFKKKISSRFAASSLPLQ